jgi:prepilin-type N-terminal cleavage/methylation domain-containing protein
MAAPKSTRAAQIAPARAAFTLMEVIVALIIVGMTAIATLSTFATELRTAGAAQYALEASALADNQLALLQLVPAEDLTNLPDSSKGGVFAEPYKQYSWTTKVTPVTGETDLFEGVVTVSWPSGRYELATRMYRPQIQVRVP